MFFLFISKLDSTFLNCGKKKNLKNSRVKLSEPGILLLPISLIACSYSLSSIFSSHMSTSLLHVSSFVLTKDNNQFLLSYSRVEHEYNLK